MKTIGYRTQFFHHCGITKGIEGESWDMNLIPVLFEIFPRIGFWTNGEITKLKIGWLCFYAHFTWIRLKIVKY